MALYLKDFSLGYLIQGERNVCRLCFKKEIDGEFASANDVLVIETEYYRDTTSYIEILQNITNMTINTEELPDKICHNCCQQLFQYYQFRMNSRMQELKLHNMVEKLIKPESERIKIESENEAINNVVYLVAYEESEQVEEVEEKPKRERKKSIIIGSCGLCGKKFKGKNSLKLHRFVCKNRDKNMFQPDIKYACSMCSASFCSESRLKMHQENVHSESKFACEKCGRLFKTMVLLNNHLTTHSDERNYKCKYCDNTFRSNNALVYHERLHTGERPYQCSHCDLKFLSASRRKTHFYIKHCEKNAGCDLCPSKFHTNSELTQHKKRVHLQQGTNKLLESKKEIVIENPMESYEYEINEDKNNSQIYIVAKRLKIVKANSVKT